MLAQLVSVALTASVKATDTKSVSSFNHFPLEVARIYLFVTTIYTDSWAAQRIQIFKKRYK